MSLFHIFKLCYTCDSAFYQVVKSVASQLDHNLHNLSIWTSLA